MTVTWPPARRRRVRLVAGFLGLAVAVGQRAAHAQAADSSVAEALFQEARRLLNEQRYGEACPKFAESQRLEPAIGTLLNLAVCHEAEGKTATAWSEFTKTLGMAQRDGRADVIEFATARLAELTPKLPKLVIVVAPEHEVAGLEVRLDGQQLLKPAWGVPAPIDPGAHTVSATARGYTTWSVEVTLTPGEVQTQAVPALSQEAATAPVPAPVSVAPVVAAPSVSPPVSAAPHVAAEPWSAQKSWALGLAGVGVVGFATSLAVGLSAKGTFDEAAPHCDASGCDDDGLKLRHDAVERGRFATVVFGVGAAALAGGAVLWLTAPSPSERAALSVGVAPRALVAKVTW